MENQVDINRIYDTAEKIRIFCDRAQESLVELNQSVDQSGLQEYRSSRIIRQLKFYDDLKVRILKDLNEFEEFRKELVAIVRSHEEANR